MYSNHATDRALEPPGRTHEGFYIPGTVTKDSSLASLHSRLADAASAKVGAFQKTTDGLLYPLEGTVGVLQPEVSRDAGLACYVTWRRARSNWSYCKCLITGFLCYERLWLSPAVVCTMRGFLLAHGGIRSNDDLVLIALLHFRFTRSPMPAAVDVRMQTVDGNDAFAAVYQSIIEVAKGSASKTVDGRWNMVRNSPSTVPQVKTINVIIRVRSLRNTPRSTSTSGEISTQAQHRSQSECRQATWRADAQ